MVVIPYQVRSYQTQAILIACQSLDQARRNPLSSQVISNSSSFFRMQLHIQKSRNPLSSQVISNRASLAIKPDWQSSRNPLSSQVISNVPFQLVSDTRQIVEVVIPYQVRSYQTVTSKCFVFSGCWVMVSGKLRRGKPGRRADGGTEQRPLPKQPDFTGFFCTREAPALRKVKSRKISMLFTPKTGAMSFPANSFG